MGERDGKKMEGSYGKKIETCREQNKLLFGIIFNGCSDLIHL